MTPTAHVGLSVDVLKQCWFLAGPTACGKTAAALELAAHINAEIVSLDSMAIYRGMDVGTAKPTPAERARTPHHLVDVVDPHEDYSLADYVAAARDACEDILAGGRTPLFVGGTGLYLRGVLRGVFSGSPADERIRTELESRAANEPPGTLYAELERIDPEAAAAIHANDDRRVVRALEVFQTTGRPLSEQQRQPPLPPEDRPDHVFWLHPPRAWLYDRINRRVDRMIDGGLVEEVRRLIEAPRPMSRTARQALGYKEIVEHLNGESTLDAAVDRIKIRTRQFAKRQHTWFRNLEECRPVEMTGEETVEELVVGLLRNPRLQTNASS